VTPNAERVAIATLVALVFVLGVARPARAQAFGQQFETQSVQITPLAGWGFGGSVRDVAVGDSRSFDAALGYGGALDLRVGQGWNVEGYYSRQPTKLSGGLAAPFDVTLERYLLGIQEEKGDERVRWFGTFWLGATRFVPGFDGFSPETKFTGGVGLGVKTFFSRNVGLRLEARGFYTVVKSEGGLFCASGNCLFAFSASGLWQGDVGGGLILAF
jgi:hypothetical protein